MKEKKKEKSESREERKESGDGNSPLTNIYIPSF